jgi:hypothetical protein
MPKSSEQIIKEAHKLLNFIPWPSELNAGVVYEQLHDDNDGIQEGIIRVQFSPDGDAWVSTDKHRGPSLRFRTLAGGGSSPRVRNALVLLALAIHTENTEKMERIQLAGHKIRKKD